MQVKKQVRTRHGTDWFQIGKGEHQGCILSPCLFNLYAEYIMLNAGLDEAQEVKSLSHVWLFGTQWTVTYQDPLSTGFSRQEYLSGLQFTSPGKSSQLKDWTWVSHTVGNSLPCEPPGKPSWIKITGRNISNLRYVDDTTLMAESEEELKSLIMKVIEDSEKGCLKTQHSKTKIVASMSISS